jgi:MFS family permease
MYTLRSIDLIGCLGGAYLLAFGMTYPILGRLHILLADLSDHRALVFLRLACMTTFALGIICCYYLTTVQGVMIGRAISGIGAAGSISGITTLLNTYPPGTNQRLGLSFLLVYTTAQLIGPM